MALRYYNRSGLCNNFVCILWSCFLLDSVHPSTCFHKGLFGRSFCSTLTSVNGSRSDGKKDT
jgi:hypothetical protein